MSGRHYPIWNEVEACNYKTSKSWGSIDTMTLRQKVGSSASNSHDFAEIATTKRSFLDPDGRKWWIFTLHIDKQPVKRALFDDKRGRPGTLHAIHYVDAAIQGDNP